MDIQKFFTSLLDISFRDLITTRIISLLYVLAAIGGFFQCVVLIVVFSKASIWLGLLAILVLAPLLFIVYLIVARVVLELLIVQFRIAENTGVLADHLRGR